MSQGQISDIDIQAIPGLTPGTYTNATVTVNVEGFVTVIANGTVLVPSGVQAPASIVFDHIDYVSTTEYITWRSSSTSAPNAGAIEFYGWQDSPDNATWNTETFHGDTYQGRALTSGNQYARARAYPLVSTGAPIVPSGWVVSSVQAYAAPIVAKRRVMLTFYPASATADAAPNVTQVARLPRGAGGVSSQWKLMSAILRVEGPNATATTAQVYYVSNPGSAAFGAGTAVLASALSAAGTTIYEVSTTVFTGSLATTGLPSGSLWAPQFSALGGTGASLELEVEEV